MKRSKLVCLSLSLLVSIGLLAGCGGEKKEAGKALKCTLFTGHPVRRVHFEMCIRDRFGPEQLVLSRKS